MSTAIVDGTDGVATIALNRPEVRNALNLEMCDALIDEIAKLTHDESIRIVFVRGNGPVFCGGADLNERKGKSEAWIRERRLRAFAAYAALEALPMPCVALVHGAAIGSGVEIDQDGPLGLGHLELAEVEVPGDLHPPPLPGFQASRS